jgi:hypothetical protein
MGEAKTHMPTSTVFRTAVCDRYQDLLQESQLAWRVWNEQRKEISRCGFRNKLDDDELRNLQARYARAYAALRNHSEDCATCQWVAQLGRKMDGNEIYADLSISA